MHIRIQRCQNCQSDSSRNILFREAGEPEKVFVQCMECKELVARYTIAPLGYFHHKKGFESFIRSFNRSGEFMSGRRVQRIFETTSNDVKENFKVVVKLLKEKYNIPNKEKK